MEVVVADSIASIQGLLTSVECCAHPTLLFTDLEGVNLSRHGSIAILQLYVPALSCVYLIDIHTLGQGAFTTTIDTGLTLKSLLQSTDYIKVFFDVRNDSDALFSHFQVDLKAVVDLQLFEFATRPGRGRFVKGLAKCIEESQVMDYAGRIAWRRTKDAGTRLFAPELGGGYEVFQERPLSQGIIDYCTQDVTVMPKLLIAYSQLLRPNLAFQVQTETLARVALSQSSTYNGKGRDKAIGPSFSWYCAPRPTNYPMSVICSEALVELCTPHHRPTPAQESISDPVILKGSEKPADVATGKVFAIEKALESLAIDTSSREQPSNGDDDDDDFNSERQYIHSLDLESDGDEKDFTACGSDCDWCGNCIY